ncbi:MAG: hypothetical protein ABSE73_30080 [Planctomycetota bacterium]
MPSVKTAVSLPKPLFEQAKRLARERKTPRSHIVAQALEQYSERLES